MTAGKTGIREVCFDTETTGFDPAQGHRVVEIACVEIFDLLPTGREFHVHVDPERDVPAEATKVHGLTREFLRGKPKFAQVAREFLDFIGDAQLVAHNASFDIRFVDAELRRLRMPPLANRYVDTVALARRKFPGAKASLDDLCRRFGIDLSGREKHGALIDTQLLARVYLELNGGRERKLGLVVGDADVATAPVAQRVFRAPSPLGLPSEEELALHGAFVGGLKNPLWDSLAAGAEGSAAAPSR